MKGPDAYELLQDLLYDLKEYYDLWAEQIQRIEVGQDFIDALQPMLTVVPGDHIAIQFKDGEQTRTERRPRLTETK